MRSSQFGRFQIMLKTILWQNLREMNFFTKGRQKKLISRNISHFREKFRNFRYCVAVLWSATQYASNRGEDSSKSIKKLNNEQKVDEISMVFDQMRVAKI